MNPMEIMMEMIDFRYLRKQKKKEHFILLYYSDSRKTSSLISLIDLAYFAIHNSQFSTLSLAQFARLDAIHASFHSSKITLLRVMYLTLRCLHGNKSRNTCIGQSTHI